MSPAPTGKAGIEPRAGLSHVAARPTCPCPSSRSSACWPTPWRAFATARRWCSASRACAGPGASSRRGRSTRRRAAGAGPAARRPARHLVAEPRRMAGDAVRHRAHRRDPGQHQPGVPAVGAGIRAQRVGLPRHRLGRAAEDLDVPGDAAHAGAGAGAQRAGRAEGGAPAGAAVGDPPGRRAHAGHAELRRRCWSVAAPALQTAAARRHQRDAGLPRRRSTSSSPAAPPATPRARR